MELSGTAVGRPTGSADLPLHGGRVPAWLSARMARLGRVVAEAIVLEYGTDELLRRLAHPFWFQAFGAVMGMDWHSSGLTTSVLGALKRGLAPVAHELDLYVCGGRGRHSRRTPDELHSVADRRGLDGEELARTSRLVAKVDSAAVQDGFQLYLHSFVVSGSGAWVVVQQGMNTHTRQARRYHWCSEGLESFVEQPHAAIEGPNQGVILNLTDARADGARRAQLELVREGPDAVVETLTALRRVAVKGRTGGTSQPALPHLALPAHHDVRPADVVLKRLHGTLASAAERGPRDFADLLLTPGLGARTVFALATVAEVVHGAPGRFSDPGRFSMALGGKDGHPFPVPLDVYDETLRILRQAVSRAKLGCDDRISAIRRLDQASRRLEGREAGPSLLGFVAGERRRSSAWRGRSVGRPGRPRVSPGQPLLPGIDGS